MSEGTANEGTSEVSWRWLATVDGYTFWEASSISDKVIVLAEKAWTPADIGNKTCGEWSAAISQIDISLTVTISGDRVTVSIKGGGGQRGITLAVAMTAIGLGCVNKGVEFKGEQSSDLLCMVDVHRGASK